MISVVLRFQSPEVEERWFVAYPLVGPKHLIYASSHNPQSVISTTHYDLSREEGTREP